MHPKRPFLGGGCCGGLGGPRFTFKNAGYRDHSLEDMEPFLRAIVREEVDRVIQTHLQRRQRPPETDLAAARFKLRFNSSFPPQIFTGIKIESVDGSPITVELVDSVTNTRAGTASSMKIEVVVLDGDFSQEDWQEEEFRNSILRERQGKKPLLVGELNVTMTDGIAVLGDFTFTDNSSWIRSRKFRLGARVIRPGIRIKEARSEAFVVKDHRGESYKKHYPPNPWDEVWRLKKIAKDGVFHSRLAKHQIHTVKDFLRVYITNRAPLRRILGEAGEVSNKMWEAIVDHASQCALDENEYYVYAGVSQGAWLLFNSVHQAVAADFEGRGFRPVDQLSFRQKLVFEELKHEAYRNVDKLIPVNGQTVSGPWKSLSNLDFQVSHQDQSLRLLEFGDTDQPHKLLDLDTPKPYSFYGYNELQNLPLQLPTAEETAGSSSGSRAPDAEDARNEGHGIIHPRGWSPTIETWEEFNGGVIFSAFGEPGVGICADFGNQVAQMERSRAGWCKIRAALKLRSMWRYTRRRTKHR